MNRLHQLLAALGIAAIALAACGGGGGTTPKLPSTGNAQGQPPAGFVRHSVTMPAASARTSYGTATVQLVLPHVYTGRNGLAVRAAHGSQIASAARRAGATTTRRSPAFVDPYGCSGGSCYYAMLDVFVDGTLITDLDSSGCANSWDSLCVQPGSDGTLSVTLPLFSSQTNDVVVAEFDSCGNECDNLLALGETWVGSFTPGTANNPPPLTMQMNAASVGILDMYNQADAEIMNGQTYYGLSGTCNASPFPQTQEFGLFSADGNGEFVPTAGYGGTSIPTLTYSAVAGTTATPQTSFPGIFYVNWDGPCDGVAVTGTAPNPAYAIYASTTNYYGPVDSYGDNTDGYEDCYNGNGPCPGGPYQGLWNMWFPYGEPYYPQNDINEPAVTGSVTITDAPSPNPSGTPF